MKRFYKDVTVGACAGGFEVLLDGRALRTPAKAAMVLPNAALAHAIAAEWQAQETKIRPTTMPVMQLASTTLDLTGRQRATIHDQLAAYAQTDLLCHRAGHPADLAVREATVWQPLLDWAALRYDATLQVAQGVMPCLQSESACRALRAAVEAQDNWRLTALQVATTGCGSLVVGLALIEGRLDDEQAFEVSQLHESFQIEQWGSDAESTAHRAALRADIGHIVRFLGLLPPVGGTDAGATL